MADLHSQIYSLKFKQGLAANVSAAATLALAIQGEPHWTTDTKDLYVFDGAAMQYIGGGSLSGLYIAKSPTAVESNLITIPNATYHGLVIKAFTAQSANLLEFKDVSDTLWSYVAADFSATYKLSSALTNTVGTVLTLGHNTSGAVANGFGSEILFKLETSTTEDQNAGAIDVVWVDATHATRQAAMIFYVYDSAGAIEAMRLIANSNGIVINEGGADRDLRVESSGSQYMVFVDAGNNRVGIANSAPQVTFDVIGTTRTGDSTTNYTQWDTTGHQTMVGTAKPWNDLRIEPVARTTGTNAPTFEKWFDDAGLAIVSAGGTTRGTWLYSFDDAAAASEKEIFFTIQMDHAWDSGDIHIHVHWIPSHADTDATPRWGLEYNWKEPCATFAETLTIYATGNECGDTDLVAGKHYITEFAALTPGATQDGLSSILTCRLFRNSSNAADTYDVSGNKCGLLYIDVHYQLNSIGSTDEYTK